MKVLVTGASGYLGKTVAALLRDQGHAVRTLQRTPSGVAGVEDTLGSITDTHAVSRAMRGINAVVHLAAKVSLAGKPADFERVNVTGTRLLLATASEAGVQRFIHVSSPSVAHAGASLVGVGATVANPALARGNYARTKAEAELIALTYTEAMHVVVIRPHLVWGPEDTQLIARIIHRAKRGTLPLLGDGTALIDTTYIDTAASGIVAAFKRAQEANGKALVLTNGEPRTVKELFDRICTAAGVPEPRIHIPKSLGLFLGTLAERAWRIRTSDTEPPMTRFLAEQLSTAHWFDQRETRTVLDWAPPVTLEEGLKRLQASFATPR